MSTSSSFSPLRGGDFCGKEEEILGAQSMAKEDVMPAERRGYVLTQTLKSGAMLRTAYNVDACAKDPEDCEGRHLCLPLLCVVPVRTGM